MRVFVEGGDKCGEVEPLDRPRLADHVAARRHVDAEGALVAVILHDVRSGEVARLGAREWALLSQADGTRDLLGIRSAAHRASHLRMPSMDEVRAFFGFVAAQGMLLQGPAPVPSVGRVERADRRIESLPNYAYLCDGSGGCCGAFATILFSPEEVARARALVPQRSSGGQDAAGAFTPEFGSGPLEQGAAAVAMTDERCVYLDEDRRCAIQRAGGANAKPAGCRQFPLVLVDDGCRVRASVTPECGCVFNQVLPGQGQRLVEAELTSDLDEAQRVRVLPQRLSLTPTHSVPREDYLALAATWLAHAEDEGARGDAPSTLWSWSRGLDGRDGRGVVNEGLRMNDALRAYAARIHAALEVHVRSVRAWRNPSGSHRTWAERLLGAAHQLVNWPLGDPLPGVRREQDEWLYVRLVLYGHQWPEETTIQGELMGRAMRLWLARLCGAAAEPSSGQQLAFENHEIAAIEALWRSMDMTLNRPT